MEKWGSYTIFFYLAVNNIADSRVNTMCFS